MIRTLRIFAGLSLLCVSAGASADAHPELSTEDRAAVRCSAAFAIVAGEQQRRAASSAHYPPLGWRGREFMVVTGERLIAAGWSREQVTAAMTEAVADLQREAKTTGNAASVLDAVMPSCLTLLNAQVDQLIEPNLPQCAAILRLSYDEVQALEGLSSPAKDLLTLATVLESRVRRELARQGRTEAEADVIVALEAESVAKVAAQPGGVERFDIATCFELAKPEEKTHY